MAPTLSPSQKLLRWFVAQHYQANLFGVIFNPYFLVRESIYHAVSRHSRSMYGVLLDFGCGSKPYRRMFNVEKYVGLDVAQSGHDHENEDIDVLYDGRTIPFSDNYFDSCFSCQVFEHVFDLPHSLQEIHRVLKPNATCLFVVPFVWEEHEIPYDFARYSSYGLRHLFEKHGFIIETFEPDSHYAKVMAQLWCAYVHNTIRTKYRYLNVALNVVFVFPFTVLGLVLQAIAPRDKRLYFNNVFVLRKKV